MTDANTSGIVNNANNRNRPRRLRRRRVRLVNAKAYAAYVKHAKRLPYINKLMKQVAMMHLEQYDNDDDRALAFVRQMYLRKVKWSTFKLYFRKLKPLFWPETKVFVSPMVFDLNNPPQNRDPDTENIQVLVKALKELVSTDRYTHPILLAYYTGLRSVEVNRIKVSHLWQLLRKDRTIPLKRKNGTEWRVYYFNQFEEFLGKLSEFYSRELEAFERYGIDDVLFNQSTSTVSYHLKRYYMTVCKCRPYPGFGLHVFRYNLATVVENREVARMILDHKDPQTTDRYYIKVNHPKTQQRINTLTVTDPVYAACAKV